MHQRVDEGRAAAAAVDMGGEGVWVVWVGAVVGGGGDDGMVG